MSNRNHFKFQLSKEKEWVRLSRTTWIIVIIHSCERKGILSTIWNIFSLKITKLCWKKILVFLRCIGKGLTPPLPHYFLNSGFHHTCFITQNHRIVEYQVGRDIWSKLSWQKNGLDKMAQCPVQPNLKSIWCWGIRYLAGEIIPMADCSHCEKISSCVQAESPQE